MKRCCAGKGGAGLASAFLKLDLVDEYRLFVSPVVLGGGAPYFPTLDMKINLELVETQTFGSRVIYLRYRHVSRSDAHGLHVRGCKAALR